MTAQELLLIAGLAGAIVGRGLGEARRDDLAAENRRLRLLLAKTAAELEGAATRLLRLERERELLLPPPPPGDGPWRQGETSAAEALVKTAVQLTGPRPGKLEGLCKACDGLLTEVRSPPREWEEPS